MTTTQIIWIVVIIVAALALAAIVVAAIRKKNAADNRARAEELREQADTRAASDLADTQASARQAEAEAERLRLEAERAEERAALAEQAVAQEQAAHEDQIRAADRLDPDVDHRSDDYTPDTSAVDAEAGRDVTDGRTAADRRATDPDTILDADDRPGRHADGGAVTPVSRTPESDAGSPTTTTDTAAPGSRRAGTHAGTESTQTGSVDTDAPVVDERGEPVLDERGNPVEREDGGSHRA